MSRLTNVRDALQMASSANTQEQRADLALKLTRLLKEAESANLNLIEKVQLAGLRKKAEVFISSVKQEYEAKLQQVIDLLTQPKYADSAVFVQETFDKNTERFRTYMDKLADSLGEKFWAIRLRCDPLSDDDWPIFPLREIVYDTPSNQSWYDQKAKSTPFGAKLWDFYLTANGKEKWAQTLLHRCGWSEEVFV